jgi:outer membrane protein TolC
VALVCVLTAAGAAHADGPTLVAAGAALSVGPTLEEAVRAATAANERARIDVRTADAAAARVEEARSFFLPSLTLTGTYTRRSAEITRDLGGGQTVTVQAENALGGNAVLALTLFDPRSIPLYRQAVLERESADATSSNDVRLFGFDVANGYLQALGAGQVAAAAQRRLVLAHTDLDFARARFQAQLARSNDVTRAELEEATAEQALTQAQGDQKNALLNLGYLVGRPLEGPLVEPQTLVDSALAPPPAAAGLVHDAHARRLDVRAARQHTEAQRQAALEPLLRYLPNVQLQATGKGTNEAGLTGKSFDWSVAAIFTWKIFDGGEALGERHEKEALADVADLQTLAIARKIDLDVGQALVALENGQAAVKQAAAGLEAAERNVRETNELYKQGLATALEVATAAGSRFDAEVAAIRARYTVALAYLGLRAAVGLDVLGEEPKR